MIRNTKHLLHPYQDSNPFATCRIRPGEIPFIFSSDRSATGLIETLRKHHWRGQIVGPHGTGKTTLLESLLPGMVKSGRQIQKFVLHSGKNSRPFSHQNVSQWNEQTQVIVDGYEQLRHRQRCYLQMVCFWKKCGLLVTSHQPVKLPLLYSTQVTAQIARQVVAQLLSSEEFPKWQIKLEQILRRNNGNLRDTLFELYDDYETQRRKQAGP